MLPLPARGGRYGEGGGEGLWWSLWWSLPLTRNQLDAASDFSPQVGEVIGYAVGELLQPTHDLPVHPRMRRADVEVVPGLREGERLRLALLQHARIPFADLSPLERSGGMRGITDIGEGQRRASFDLGSSFSPLATAAM